jgi:hypothetical protein
MLHHQISPNSLFYRLGVFNFKITGAKIFLPFTTEQKNNLRGLLCILEVLADLNELIDYPTMGRKTWKL